MDDLAVVTGAQVVNPEVGLALSEVGLEVLGRARRIGQNGAVSDYRWFNQGHPQTLQTAVILLYLNGVLGLLLGSYGGLLVCVAMVVGAFGIANDKKWGYGLSIAAAALDVLYIFKEWGIGEALTNFNPLLSVMIGGALVALLLHPMSRNYQRIWFR